jgi:hypothetical protein
VTNRRRGFSPAPPAIHTPRDILVLAVVLIFLLTACSQGPHDAILFERATAAVEQKRFTVANLTLQTLVATYPDSEYAVRAKRMLLDPRIARCGGGFSTAVSLCDPEALPVPKGQ